MRLTNKTILFFILLLGSILRFWNFPSIPFSHDEFSALFRTQFSSFGELISQGVKPDGHPAGIQVFLYYWTQIFGSEEWVVKLPFALMGVCSIWLLYRIGSSWHNETVGLLSAAFMACLQFPIVYSVTARPYISGMFFSLAMVFFWSKLIKSSSVGFWKNGALFVLFASLCSYNHHFSLLFSAIVGLSGLFFIPRALIFKYMLLGLAILLLYTPHFEIFFYQLSHEGIEGWLAKPHQDFLWVFIRYIFHYSWLLLALAFVILTLGLFYRRNTPVSIKTFLLFLSWFLLPFLIGYYYSINVNSVLQYSVLIFSFPYLFLVIFGHISTQKPLVNGILVILISVVSVFTLIQNRKHFRLLYNSHYSHIITDSELKFSDINTTTFIINSHKPISEYYIQKNYINQTFHWADSFKTELRFRNFIRDQSSHSSQIYFGAWSSSNPNYIPIIKEYFPCTVWQQKYVGGSTYLFSSSNTTISDQAISCIDFSETNSPNWSQWNTSNITNDIEQYYTLDSTSEWSPSYTIHLDSIITHPNDFIDISLYANTLSDISRASIVVVIEEHKKTIHWNEVDFSRFENSKTNQWQKVHYSIKLSDITFGNDAILKVFVWNKDNQTILLDDFEIKVREGNKYIYGLRDEF